MDTQPSFPSRRKLLNGAVVLVPTVLTLRARPLLAADYTLTPYVYGDNKGKIRNVNFGVKGRYRDEEFIDP